MSVTISESGGKLSKRERPTALRKAIKARPDIYLEKLADIGGIGADELKSFLAGDSTPDVPRVEAMAKYLGVELPEINVVDFFKSGYIPEAVVNFIALLGWNPGDPASTRGSAGASKREIMPLAELIDSFDISRLTKSNSLFDRGKLVAFNTEHIKMLPPEKLLGHLKAYLAAISSPAASAADELLLRIIKCCEGARTLADIERKSRFLFIANEKIEYDEKAVQKVLLKDDGLAMLKIVRDKLAAMSEFTEKGIEDMLRSLAEEKQVGLGKVAQPLRVAITGTTISPPIFDSVQLLGKENTLARINITLAKFGDAK
jgi:glutamyl-tRNA synthetase